MGVANGMVLPYSAVRPALIRGDGLGGGPWSMAEIFCPHFPGSTHKVIEAALCILY